MKRIAITAAATLLLVSGAGVGVGMTGSSAAPAASPTKVVYLTFDDGPTVGYTDEVLADLKVAGAHATFFQEGEHFAGNEDLMRRLVAAGNQVGTHSWSHPNFSTTTDKTVVWEQIQKTRWAQIRITGVDSHLFRYPFVQSSSYGDTVLMFLSLQPVGATVQPQDWMPARTDATVINQVMGNVANGSIVILHDGNEGATRTGGHPRYLPALLTQLKAAGYTFNTIGSGQALPVSAKVKGVG